VRSIINFESIDTFKVPYVRTKSTQAGKTGEKSIVNAVCCCFGILQAVVTKGDRESKELLAKMKNFALDDQKDLVVGKIALRKSKSKRVDLQRVLENGGTIVVADTKAQMEKLNYALKNHLQDGKNSNRLIATVDEGTFSRVVLGF